MDWNNLGEVTDWNDLDRMIESDGRGGDGSGAQKKKDSRPPGGSSGMKMPAAPAAAQHHDTLENVAVDGWTDMKQFDDDHDPDWFEEEELRLAKIYGGHFIKVKYTEQGRPGYFCELCLSEMNAKKSLESHCEGMKHLKKKALWEKSNNEDQDDGRGLEVRGGWGDPSGHSNRGFGGRDRSPLRRSRDRQSPAREMRGKFGGGGRPDRDREMHRGGYRGRADDLQGRGSRNGGSPPSDRYRGSLEDRLDGPPGDRYGRPEGPGMNRNGGGPSSQWLDRDTGPPEPCAVPLAAPPKEKLKGGTTGLLLTKLASCYIKDEEDADLALNVVSSLASSLREFYTKKGEKKIAELLMEAELKLNTLKALKVGLKLLGNKVPAAQSGPVLYTTPAVVSAPPRPTMMGGGGVPSNVMAAPQRYAGYAAPSQQQQYGYQYPAGNMPPVSNMYGRQ